MQLCNRKNIQACDQYMIQDQNFPSFTLMEKAAEAFVHSFLTTIHPDIIHDTIVILCGPGNNGGDGFAVARMLHLKNYSVRIQICSPPESYSKDASLNYQLAHALNIPISDNFQPIQANIIIDAIAGTGIQGALQSDLLKLLDIYRDTQSKVIALDLPSGLNASTGEIFTIPLQASHTFTFHLPKICQYVYPAAAYCGEVQVLDIGIFPEAQKQSLIAGNLITHSLLKRMFQARKMDAHKGDSGHVLLVAGQKRMPGAALLSARSAFRAGAGKVTVASPQAVIPYICESLPEAMFIDSNPASDVLNMQSAEACIQQRQQFQAMMIGPGIGTHPDTAECIFKLITEIKIPMLLDADALNLLSAAPEYLHALTAETIITPHPGEMKRLYPAFDPNQRLEAALNLSAQYNIIVVLKGAGTIVANPQGNYWVCPFGNPVLATAGSGDILSGIIGALLASGYSSCDAAVTGVALHAIAADLLSEFKKDGNSFYEASSLLAHLPAAIDRISA